MFIDDEEDTVVIELYVSNLNGQLGYAGADQVLGKANVCLIDGKIQFILIKCTR